MAVAPAQAGPVPPPVVGTISSTNPADYTPHAQNGDTRAYAQIGDTVYVGGTFTSIKTTARPAGRPAATSSRTTAPTVRSSRASRRCSTVASTRSRSRPTGKLIVGGAFKNVNGVSPQEPRGGRAGHRRDRATWNGRGDGGTVRALDRPGQLALRLRRVPLHQQHRARRCSRGSTPTPARSTTRSRSTRPSRGSAAACSAGRWRSRRTATRSSAAATSPRSTGWPATRSSWRRTC